MKSGNSLSLDKTDCTAINCPPGTFTPVVTARPTHHTVAIIAGIRSIDRVNDGSPGESRKTPSIDTIAFGTFISSENSPASVGTL